MTYISVVSSWKKFLEDHQSLLLNNYNKLLIKAGMIQKFCFDLILSSF